MRLPSLRFNGVVSAISTGAGQSLFVQNVSNWGVYDAVFSAKGTLQFNLNSAAVLGPGVVGAFQTGTGQYYYLTPKGATPQFIGNFMTYWNGTGATPTVPYWMLEGNNINNSNALSILYILRADWVFTVQTLRGQVGGPAGNGFVNSLKRSSLGGFQKLDTKALTAPPPVGPWWPAGSTHFRVRVGNIQGSYLIGEIQSSILLRFYAPGSGWGSFDATQQSAAVANLDYGTAYFPAPDLFNPTKAIPPAPSLTDPYQTEIEAVLSTYHNGRSWATAGKLTQWSLFTDPTVNTSIAPQSIVQAPPPNMLYFSEVFYTDTTQATVVSFPRWIPENNLQIPFKVSTAITGLVSLGRYLYILGDNEAFILSGSSNLDYTLESIGDSIGCVSSKSVQRLGGKAIWLGAGSVFVVQGGQVTDVGVDIRDLLLSLNLATLSSTVDFVKDTYFLSDGAITICLHIHEGG